MSKITTRSMFYYDAVITRTTKALDFDEGAGEINANLNVGNYTMQGLADEMARAMSEAGDLVYSATFDRDTREITISAASPFTLRTNTGSRAGVSPWATLGFSTAANYTGASTYTGALKAGKVYETQFPVDRYVDATYSRVKESATVVTSATGVTQLISFGEGARVEMNIRLITDLTGINNTPFLNNATGRADFMTFITAIMEKTKVEFMPDRDDASVFVPLILESTKEDRSGLRFELKNMKTPNFYESGALTFRKVIE